MTQTKHNDREQQGVDRVLNILDQLMARTREVDAKPRDFDTGVTLHRAEIHTVQAIGKADGCNVKSLAERLGVTKGAASQTVSKLVRKGLVEKTKAPDNDKEVLLRLTELGWRGYHAHERMHASIAQAFKAHHGASLADRLPVIQEVLADLLAVVDIYADMADHR